MKEKIEVGRIVNTHGLDGTVKIQHWCNSIEDFFGFQELFIANESYAIEHIREHKGCLLVKLSGIDSIDRAETLKNQTVYQSRSEIPLADNEYFIQDMIGCHVFDERKEKEIGVLSEVLFLNGNDVLVVKEKAGSSFIPINGPFLQSVDLEHKTITVKTIEGMLHDED